MDRIPFQATSAGALYEDIRRLPVSVMLDNVRSLYNTGAFFRTADAAGLEKLYLCGITGRPDTAGKPKNAITKTALGAEETVPWEHAWEPLPVIGRLRAQGVEVAAIETSLHAVDLFDWRPRFPVCVVFGHEVDGIRPEISAACDTHVRIPMLGLKHSLNVATAGGVVIYELLRKYRARLRYYKRLPQPLPPLRRTLDYMPSPAPEHPGLFIRDPYKFSDAMLVVPPALVECLDCFDGRHTDLDLRAELVRITGQLDISALCEQLVGALDQAGFLENETFAQMEAARRAEFTAKPVREPAHSGAAYPDDVGDLRETMIRWLPGPENGASPSPTGARAKVRGIAAPHVSPEGGWRSYQAAFENLGPEDRDRTFVILATSHYGMPEKFGLTRKDYRTPFGDAKTDLGIVDWLEQRAPQSVLMEDYCHSFEHSAEFQALFLQQALGANVRIAPILCGSFARSLYRGGMPEDDDHVRRFFDALGELAEREGDRICWVLGVDMAHMGARYTDGFSAAAHQGPMAAVEERDRRRIEAINAGDAGGFWEQVKENHDDLKWCGSSPFYTFLKAAPNLRGELLRYEQWNIDANSVVSFAGMAFR